jgi:hypothetical protein
MRIYRRNGLPEPPAGRTDDTTEAPARRLRWRSRRRRDRVNAPQVPGSEVGGDQTPPDQTPRDQTARDQTARERTVREQAAREQAALDQAALDQTPREQTPREQTPREQTASGETRAAAMQLAIALLTAGLDSPELEAWAADELTPIDADGLGDFMAGLHVISVLLLNELHEVTGEPSAAILQRLAILAERQRGTPFAD